jgi:anhydro-N-acetylmuramic acid kinase
MFKHIEKLHQIASSSERLIIGLMSGTSLDGLDIALCRVSGHGKSTQLICEKFQTVKYTESFKLSVQQVFSKQHVSLDALCLLNAQIGRLHGEMINQVLAAWDVPKQSVDLIASHGQTIYHRPSSLHQTEGEVNSTLQIGDGDHIAVATGITTVSDFRQKHIAYGGEGAPLAIYGDYILLSSEEENRTLLNIGGISNITYLPQAATFDELICSDIGPGNTIMNALARQHTPDDFDKDAGIARQGKVHQALLDNLLEHPFFALPLPKTTGPETFNLDWFNSKLQEMDLHHLSLADQMATLNMFTAQSIVNATKALPTQSTIYLSGGGAHNPLLRQNISRLLKSPIHLSEQLNIDMDAKEAILFAVLANECIAGDQHAFASKNAKQGSLSMGKLSFP